MNNKKNALVIVALVILLFGIFGFSLLKILGWYNPLAFGIASLVFLGLIAYLVIGIFNKKDSNRYLWLLFFVCLPWLAPFVYFYKYK